MALQNFVDRVGPVLSADWLNQVDVDLNARLTSKQVGMSSSKSASYNRGALQDAVNSGLGRLDIITDYAGETFLIDGAIDVPNHMEIEGINRWGCNISSTSLSEPIFRFGSSNTRNALRGLHLSYSGTPLAGANAIESNGSYELDLHRITISSCWNGVYLYGGVSGQAGNHELAGLRIYSYEQCGLLLDGCIDVNLSVFRFSALNRPGTLGGLRLIGAVEAFTASQGDITLGRYGMTVDAYTTGGRGDAPFYNRFSKVFFDSSLYNPAYLRYAQHIDFESCWFASAGHDASDTGYTALTDHAGIDMENCQHIRFIGGDTYGNGGNGVNHYGANKHITYHGMGFKRNGRWRNAARAGINVLAGATDFSVHGCTFEEDADTAEFRQSIAVNVNTGASNKYAITGNTLGGCTVIDGGTGTDKNVTGNVGNGSIQTLFNICDAQFGAVGDNSTNCTTAVQAAITAAEAVNGTVFVPAGIYRISGLTISAAITLKGEGALTSELRMIGASNANGITVAVGVGQGLVIEELMLNGVRSANTSGHAIHFPIDGVSSYGQAAAMRNLYLTEWAGDAVRVDGNRNNGYAYNVSISRCTNGLRYDAASDWRVTSCGVGICDERALYVVSGADNVFTSCSFFMSIGTAAVTLAGTSSSPTKLIGCTINGNQLDGLEIVGPSGIARHIAHVIMGCWFETNGLATNDTYADITCTDVSGVIFIGNTFRYPGTGNKPKYTIEFGGATASMQWMGNSVSASPTPYATALTNTDFRLYADIQGLNLDGQINADAAYFVNAVDDAAAAAASVPVGRFYRNGSVLMLRVS